MSSRAVFSHLILSRSTAGLFLVVCATLPTAAHLTSARSKTSTNFELVRATPVRRHAQRALQTSQRKPTPGPGSQHAAAALTTCQPPPPRKTRRLACAL